MAIINMAGGGGGAGKVIFEESPQQIYFDKFTWPTKYADGTDVPTSLTINGKQAKYAIMNMAKSIRFPSRFAYVDITFQRGTYDYVGASVLSELIFDGALSITMANSNELPITKISAPVATALTGFLGNINDALRTDTVKPTSLELDIPKYDGNLTSCTWGTSTVPLALTLNAPLVKGFCTQSGTSYTHARYCTGVNVLPSVTTHGNLNQPYHGDQTWRFPAIETVTDTMLYSRSGSHVLHLYYGPHLHSLAGATNIVNNPTIIDIHIPPGETTTKVTLDGLNIPYTQDYNYWEDEIDET